MHLGVTTSPHIPFPAGYITQSVYDWSLPLRLALPRSGKWIADTFGSARYHDYIPHMLVPQNHTSLSIREGRAHHR